jgi:methionyl-tRNA formyltransferase
MGNNWVGWQVIKWLKKEGEAIEGLVVHPPKRQKYTDEITKTADLPKTRIFDGSRINEVKTINAIKSFSPDIGLSILFGYILKKEIINVFPQGIINLHPAYLPYNRGQYPNVWSIVDGTPAGVTIHFMDEGVDTGDIVAREEVDVEPTDTGESLYRKLEKKSVELFKMTWPLVRDGKFQRIEQDLSEGTYHRTADVQSIDEIQLNMNYRADDLINILRARTFPPYKGAYFMVNGKKVYIRVHLEYED